MTGRTIGDWYADAEGRHWDVPGYDWENDDKPDQTPDSWIDRLPPQTQRLPPARSGSPRKPGPSRRRTTTGSTASAADRRVAPASAPVLKEAARLLRSQLPGAKAKTIARKLREKGWLNATTAQVQAVVGDPVPQTVRRTERNPLDSRQRRRALWPVHGKVRAEGRHRLARPAGQALSQRSTARTFRSSSRRCGMPASRRVAARCGKRQRWSASSESMVGRRLPRKMSRRRSPWSRRRMHQRVAGRRSPLSRHVAAVSRNRSRKWSVLMSVQPVALCPVRWGSVDAHDSLA